MTQALALLPALPLGLTLLNLATWRRPQGLAGHEPAVAVLIPARNEAHRIAEAMRSALESRYPSGASVVQELLVYDDASVDGTADVVQALGRDDPRVRLLSGGELPDGWTGKPHACQRLLEATNAEVLVLMDADVRLEPGGLARFAGEMGGGRGLDWATAVPRQLTGTYLEHAVVSLLVVTYLSWLPLVLIERSRDPRFLAANGQLLAMTRDAHHKLGGFQLVRDKVVEDVALGRAAKSLGLRVGFFDGAAVARCRMYRNAGEVWRGFSKNIAPGLGGSSVAVALVAALYLACFVLPYVGFGFGAVAGHPAALLFGAVGVAENVMLRALVAVRFQQPKREILLHPVSTLALLLIAANSLVWTKRSGVAWAGRVYKGVSG